MNWFTSTLLATLAYGVLQGLQKIATSRSVSLRGILLASATTVALMAGGCALLTGALEFNARLLLIAAVNATLFAAGSLLVLGAMQRAPAALVLPANRLDTLIVVLIGAIGFGERPSGVQWLGAGLGLGVVGLLSAPGRGESRGNGHTVSGLTMAIAAAFCFAGSMTAGKIAATTAPRLSFVAVSYSITALIALATLRLGETPASGAGGVRASLGFGALIGVLNFVGYLLILEAFAAGPLSLIQPIFASSMLVAIWISRRALGERVNLRQGIALGLSIAAAVLIRLGD